MQSLKYRLQNPDRRRRLVVLALLAAGVVSLWIVLQSVYSPPDFRRYEAGPERKAAFFGFMRPLIEAENQLIRADRERLLEIAAEDEPGWLDRRWLLRVAGEYGLEEPDPGDSELVSQLLRRVDTVPPSLALAQAAKESGWGTSRFARKGNNFFGERCFDKGCGMVPEARVENRTHEVQTFVSPRRSVASYVHNINTHWKYRAFRSERARLRAQDRRLSGVTLAETLSHYSERRDAYVEEIKKLILANDLDAPHSTESG